MKTRLYNNTKDKKAVETIFLHYWTDEVFLDELEKALTMNGYTFYIAEENDEIIGVAGLRIPPEHLRILTDTNKPIELYIIASKYQNKGIGTLLGKEVTREIKKSHYTEMICYSPETHSNSWKFYEKLDFKSLGIIKDPEDGYPGMVWDKIL